jgi:hypothetical protein
MDNGQWVEVTGVPIKSFWAFNLDGQFRDDLVVTLKDKVGLYIKPKNINWLKIHDQTPLNVWCADTDGDGQDDIAANFGPGVGTYVRLASGKWTNIWSGSPTHIEPADVNGNGKDDLVFYIDNHQTYIGSDDGQWTLLYKGLTHILAGGDIDVNGEDDIVFSLGIGYKTSTWAWMNISQWAEIATGDALGNLNGLPGLGSCGDGVNINCGWLPNLEFVRNTYTFANFNRR